MKASEGFSSLGLTILAARGYIFSLLFIGRSMRILPEICLCTLGWPWHGDRDDPGGCHLQRIVQLENGDRARSGHCWLNQHEHCLDHKHPWSHSGMAMNTCRFEGFVSAV